MSTNDKKFINIESVRSEHQKGVMVDIEKAGHCPFCKEQLALYHKRPIIKDGTYWVLTENQWPYEHTRIHLLAIHKEHVERLSDITEKAFAELLSFFQWAEREYAITGGAVAMRFGDIAYTGSSVSHLHAHLIQSDIDKPDYETVRFKMGPSSKKKA
jgi:diadenosine tetraphosphate (Ap4A) HIT family hydrolase